MFCVDWLQNYWFYLSFLSFSSLPCDAALLFLPSQTLPNKNIPGYRTYRLHRLNDKTLKWSLNYRGLIVERRYKFLHPTHIQVNISISWPYDISVTTMAKQCWQGFCSLLISKCTLRSESGSVTLGKRNYLFCCSYVYCHSLRCLPYKPARFINLLKPTGYVMHRQV